MKLTITKDNIDKVKLIEDQTKLLTYPKSFWHWLAITKTIYKNLNKQYRPYQPYHAALHLVRKRNIMAHEQGVGKTIQCCLVIAALYKLNRPGQVHITIHSELGLLNWSKELDSLKETQSNWQVIRSIKDLSSDRPIWIYTHDLPKRSRGSKGNRNSIGKLLGSKYRPSMLIIDECDNLLQGTNRTKHLKYIADRSNRVLAISGTVTDNKISNLYHLLKLVYGKLFPYESASSFSREFTVPQKVKTTYISGEQQKDKFIRKLNVHKLIQYHDLITRYIHRVRLSDNGIAEYIKLPTVTERTIAVKPTDIQKKKQQDYINLNRKTIEAISDKAVYSLTALSLIQPLIDLANLEPTNKLAALIENLGNKTVVFVNKVNAGDYLQEKIPNALRLESTQTDEQRAETVRLFETDNNFKVLIASINIANASIDLVSADTIIFYDYHWKETKIMQGIKRVVRSGNLNEEVNLVFLYTDSLIDQHQYTLFKQKEKTVKQLSDFDITEDLYDEQEEDLSLGTVLVEMAAVTKITS